MSVNTDAYDRLLLEYGPPWSLASRFYEDESRDGFIKADEDDP